MKDPDEQEIANDGDSTELEEDFDFVQAARDRANLLFKRKRSKDSNEKALSELMKKNDLKLINRMLQLAADNIEALDKKDEQIDEINKELRQVTSFRREFGHFLDQTKKSIEETKEKVIVSDRRFKDFKDVEFPKYMSTFKEECVVEVIQQVSNIKTRVVTVEMLAESLKEERDGAIQNNINDM